MAARIEQDILIDAPVDVVWRAVTEPELVATWFADGVDLEPTPGYQGSLSFRDPHTDRTRAYQVTVRSVEPERAFSYRWLHPAGATAAEGNSALVEFTLTPEAGGTRLRVVETGVEAMGWPPAEEDSYTREHNEGWATYLGRLRDQFR